MKYTSWLKIAYYSGFLSSQITLVSEWLVLKEEVKEEYIEPVFNKEAKEEDIPSLRWLNEIYLMT